MGHRVVICTYHPGRDLPHVDIRRAPSPNPLDSPLLRRFRTQDQRVRVGSSLHKLSHDTLLALTSARTALAFRPTIIHAHLHEGALIGFPLSRTLRVPLVFDFQGSLTSEMLDHRFITRHSPLFGPLYRMEHLINRGAHRIITSSRNATDLLIRDFGRDPERVTTLADSVDTCVFRPRWELPDPCAASDLRRQHGIPEDRTVVVYLGLLAGYQGTGLLLEAAAQLIALGLPVHFLIMGFPGEDDYREQARQMGLAHHTTFTGKIPYQDAPLYLAAGDVAVSPKISETEGNGKLLNYMACGLPTVSFDTPVALEILGDLGCYAKMGDATDLARALRVLVEDPGAREARGRALRNRAVEHFSWEGTGRRLVAIYDSLTGTA